MDQLTEGRKFRDQLVAWLAYAAFVLVGLGAGVTGVLLVAQIRDYGVDQATIGLTFITGGAGFFLGSATAGALIHRWGTRTALLIGGVVYVVAGLGVATRPALVAFVLLQALTGYATGILESVLNAHLAALPRSTTLLNRLHAFFGVGALVGPLLATRMLKFTTWPVVSLVLALVCIPLMVAIAFVYPRQALDPVTTSTPPPSDQDKRARLLPTALRQRGVQLGALLLAVYVGLELGVGNWGYSYLVDARGVTDEAAGYTISGYWLGLTVGRFLISPTLARLGWTAIGQLYACLAGVAAAIALTWLVPMAGAAGPGFVLLGFFLGPIFPTTMAVTTQLTVPRLAPTAIGIMNAGSVVGGAALPWLAGAAAQSVGAWTLLPFALILALLQLVVWWRIGLRLAAPSGGRAHAGTDGRVLAVDQEGGRG